MCHDEVLATGFSHDARVGFVLGNVLSNGLPEVTEHAGGPGEVKSSKVWVGEDHVACSRPINGHEVDDALGQACCVKQLHDDVGGIDLVVGRLPDHHIAHQGSGDGQVASDGREVEWCDGKNEAFQRAVFQAVPKSRSAFGLLSVNLLCEVAIEPEEVDELTRCVDFGLVEVFALGEHCGCIDAGAPGASEHLGSPEENAGALLPLEGRPGGSGFQRRVDGLLDMLGGAEMSVADDALMVVWRGQGALVLGEDLSAANHHGDRDGILVEHALILGELGLALEAAGAVSEDGFIFRIRNLEKGVGHGVSLWPQM